MSAVLLGNNVVNILSASLTTAVLTALFGAAGVVYATVVDRRPGGDLRRGDAQDLGPAARRPRGADRWRPRSSSRSAILGPMARAVAWISRFFLGLLGVRVDRTPDAEEQADVLRGAIELHGHGQADETAPAEKAMLRSVLDLGDRTGRRRHDPSRQRRADRRRPARPTRSSRRCWRRPTRASRSIAAEPDNIVGVRARQGPVPRRARRRGGPDDGQDRRRS